MILLGSFVSGKFSRIYVVIATSGVVFAAVYMLWMFQRVMFGKLDNPKNQELKDLRVREIAGLGPIIVFIIWIGVYPKPFLSKIEKSVNNIVILNTKDSSKSVLGLVGTSADLKTMDLNSHE